MSWRMRVGYVLVKVFWLQVTETDLSQLKLKVEEDSISMQTFLASYQKKATLAEEGRRLGTGRLSIFPVLTSASHLLVSLRRHLCFLFYTLHRRKVASRHGLVYVLNLSPL